MVNDNNWFFNSLISFISIVDDSKSRNGRGGEKKSIHENYSKFPLPLYKYIITQLMR